jgi:FdhD protein
VSDRPRVGVSSCLLGEAVRYNGGHKRDEWIADVLGPTVDWVPVCPEVEAGFGTPREAMQVERASDGTDRLMTVSTRRDMTGAMEAYAGPRIEALARERLDGYVFKDNSPSCDPAFGLFAASVQRRLTDLPVIDERELAEPGARDAFVARVFAHHRAGLALRSVRLERVDGARRCESIDTVAVEEPLEVRLHGRPFAVIMRTPGADRELAAGFLLAERVISSADDLGTIEYCHEQQPQRSQRTQSADFEKQPQSAQDSQRAGFAGSQQNIVNVILAGAAAASLERVFEGRRNVATNSSCGLCGRQTIESLATGSAAIDAETSVAASVLAALPDTLRQSQTVFAETGGLHAAGLFTTDGALVDIAEDVGRHNAVDKVVGRMLMRERLPLSDRILCVSGRTSFEIVQKALFAGIPILAAVSAPSSLAIDLAERVGITLTGFVRGGGFNVYAHPGRIVNDERRTPNDERRTTNDERRTSNDERRTSNDERRTSNDERD